MAVRTTVRKVEAILGKDFGPLPNGDIPDLTPYIEAASSVMDTYSTMVADRILAITAAQLELMERWLSAHFYTKMDPTYSSRSTGGASGQFIRDEKDKEPYKNGACMLDPYAILRPLIEGRIAGGGWLGRVPIDQTPADQRGY